MAMDLVPIDLHAVDLAGHRIMDCDMDAKGNVAVALDCGAGIVILAGGRPCVLPSDDDEARAQIAHIAWLPDGRVLAWPFRAPGAEISAAGAIVTSPSGFERIHLGLPDQIFVSTEYIFVSYSEGRVIGAAVGPYDDDIVTVFDHTGKRLFGLSSVLPDQTPLFVTELSCGRAEGDILTFTGDGTGNLCLLDASRRSFHAIQPERPIDPCLKAIVPRSDGEIALMSADALGLHLRLIDRHGQERPGASIGEETIRRAFGNAVSTLRARGVAGGHIIVWSPVKVVKVTAPAFELQDQPPSGTK